MKVTQGASRRLGQSQPSNQGSQYDAREALGIEGGGDRSSSGGVSKSFMDRYNQIKAASGGEREDQSTIMAPGTSGRRGEAVDHFIAGMGNIGDAIQSWSGQEEAAKTETPVDDALSFLGGLVTGTFSAPFTGVAQLGEAITGHRATEMDENGFIPEDDLDLGQRIATGLSGGINALGPRFGGSWEMLSGGKRAIQAGIGAAGAAAGKQWGVDMLEGAVRRASSDAGRSFGRELAKDMAEEGLEEFVQSPLDEIREGTFDDDWLGRAAEAGVMGAVGGGIMSGVGQGLNYGLSKLNPPSDARPTDTRRQGTVSPGAMQGISDYSFNRNRAGEMLPDAQEAAVESLRNRTTSPGSASVLQASTGKAHGINSGDIGADVFREIFYKPDNGRSAKMVSDWFGTDVSSMARVMASDDYAGQLAQMHRANKEAGKARPLKLGRNPATEKVGRYDVDVDEIVDGGFIDLAPMTYNFVKSDVDGDKVSVYLDPAVTTEGYITRRLVSSVAANWNDEKQRYERKSNVEFSDFAFMPKSYSKERAREIFSGVFDSVVGKQDAVDPAKFADEMASHIRTWDDADYAMFFANIMQEVNKAKADKKIGESVSADRLASELMRELADSPEAVLMRTLDNDIKKLEVQTKDLADSIVRINDTVTTEDPNARSYQTAGAVPDAMDSLVRIWSRFNLVSAKLSTGATNVLFRQDGALVMRGQSKQLRQISDRLETIASEIDPDGRNGVFQKILSITIKQAEIGGDIINNVSGIFDSMVRSQVMIRALSRMNGAPQTGQQMTDMLTTFREEWNKVVPAYERAVEQATTQGLQEMRNSATKPELKSSDPFDIENVRYFVETFGDVDLKRILPVEKSRGLEGHTLNSWLEAYVGGGRTDRTQFGGMDHEFQQFIDTAIAGHMARLIAVEQSFGTFSKNLAPVLRRLYEGGLDKADRAEAEFVLTSIRRLFDPEVANRLGLVSIDNLDTGKWGRELVSGSADRVSNAILSMALVGKYDAMIRYANEAKRLLSVGQDERAQSMLLRARNEAGRLALMSRLDTLVVSEAYESLKSLDDLRERDVVSVTYDALTDLDISYDEKVRALSQNDASNGIRVISDALSTDSNAVGASGLSNKMIRANSQLQSAMRASRSRNLTLWEGIRANFSASGKQQVAASAIVDLLADSYYDNSVDVVSGAIYATTTLANAFKEKGMTPLASQMLYQAAEMNLNGALQSFSAKVFGRALGEISLKDFNDNPRLMLDILMNPGSSIKVVDEVTQRSGVYTRERMIREATGNQNASNELTFANLDAIFTKWPQLITLIPEQELTPSVSEGESKPTLTQKNKRSVMASILNRMGETEAVKHTRDMKYREGSAYAHRRSKKVAQAAILCDTDVISALIRRMGDISGDVTLPGIQRRMRRTFDDFVEGILDIATSGASETQLCANINMLKSSQAVQLARSISSAYDSAAALVSAVEAGKNLANATYAKLKSDLDVITIDNAVRDLIGKVAGDKAGDAISSYARNVTNVNTNVINSQEFLMSRAQHDANELWALLTTAFPQELNPEISFRETFSNDLIDATIERVRGIDGSILTDEKKNQIIDVLNGDDKTALIGSTTSDFDFSDRVLQLSDFTNVDVRTVTRMVDKFSEQVTVVDRDGLNRLVSKILDINKRFNFASESDVDNLRSSCRDIILGLKSQSPDAVGKSVTDASQMMRKWNSFVVKDFIAQKRLASRGDVNPNLLNAYYEDTVALERMITRTRNSLNEAGLPVTYPDAGITRQARLLMDIPDFTDPVKDIMANRAKVNTTRGPAAITVGLNGAGNRDREGLTLIPRDHHTDVAPVPMTYADMRAENDLDSTYYAGTSSPNWNRFIGARYVSEGEFAPWSSVDGKMPYKTKVITTKTIADLEANPDAQIYVFDPLDSPNGIDVEHSYPSFSGNLRNSLRVLQEIGMMGDGTQEGLALKSAKTVGNVDSIATRTTEDYTLTHVKSVDPSVFGSASLLRPELVRSMKDFRRYYAVYLNGVFSDESNKILGLGPMQAIDFARLLTPYFEVECENGSTIISAIEVFSPDDTALDSRLAAIRELGIGEIVSIKPVSVTPETISARIGKKIADETNRLGKTPKASEAEKIALRAVQDWSDFGVNQLSIDDMMTGFRGYSRADVPYMIGDDAQTIYNQFIDDVYGNNAGTTIPGALGVSVSRGTGVENGRYERNAEMFEREASPYVVYGGNQVSSPPDFVVFKAFGTEGSPDSNLHQISMAANRSGLYSTPDDVNGYVSSPGPDGRSRRTVAIVLNADGLADAARWGVAYNADILVPMDMLGDERGKLLVDCISSDKGVKFGISGDNVEFAIVSPYRSKEMRYVSRYTPASQSLPIEAEDIYINVFNYAKYLADAGGVANISTTRNAGTNESRDETIPMRSLFAGLDVTDMSLCDADDVRGLRTMIDSDADLAEVLHLNERTVSGRGKEWVIDQTRSFVEDMTASREVTGTYRTEADRFQVIAIAKATAPNGSTVYAPILLDGNQPKHVTGIAVRQDGLGNVQWSGDAFASIIENEALKVVVPNVPYKGVIVPTDPSNMTRIAAMIGDADLRADFDLNYETYAGRVDDMSAQIMLQNLWYSTLKFGGSLLYEQRNGAQVERDVFYASGEKVPNIVFRNLVDGIWDNGWEFVASGQVVFSHTDPALNDLIAKVTMRAHDAHIPLNYLFSTVSGTSESGSPTVLRGMDVDYQLALADLNRYQMLKLFHLMNPDICPDCDANDSIVETGKTLLNQFGQIYTLVGNGDTTYVIPMDCVIGPGMSLGHSTMIDRQSFEARWSMQRQQRGGLETPLTGREARNVMEDLAVAAADARAYGIMELEGESRRIAREDKEKIDGFTPVDLFDPGVLGDLRRVPGYSRWTTYKEILHQRSMLDTAKTFRTQLPIMGFDGKEIDNPNPDTHKRAGTDPHATEVVEIRNAMDKVSRALGGDIDWQHFQWLLMYQNGITLNDGVGSFRMTVPEISRSADQIVESLSKPRRPLPVATDETRMMTLDDRYSMPLLSPDMAEYMFQFPTISQAYDTMAEFRSEMVTEAMVAKQLVENIVANGTTSYRAHKARLKRDALFKFLDWTFHENGLPEVSGHVYGDEYVSDVVSNETSFWSKIFGNPSMKADREMMLAESKRTAQHIADLNKLRMTRTNEFESGDFSTTSILGSDAGTINGVLDFMTRVSQTMSILSPSVAFSNIVDKGVHTNLTFAALSMGRHGIGPYGTDVQVSQDAIKMFAEDPRVQKVFVAYRMAMIDGDVASLVNIVDNEQQLDAWLQQKAQRGGAFKRLSDLAFNLANGGNIFMNRQLRNFANYFFMIERDAGHDWWFRNNPDGVMVAEAQLAGHNPQHFILDVLMGRNDNASFGNAQVAMNFALQGDMAQRNVVSMLYQEAVRRYGSSVKFLTSTFLSKFFVYRTNQIGRLLNTVMPMSSINFVVTNWVANNTEVGRAIHVEDAQVFTQLKRAAMSDALHMSPHLLGIVLAMIPGLLMPPEDEDKRGNPQEWMFAGQRIYTDWELEDILGLSLPIAVFWKTVLDGHADFSVLANGISQATYNNPMAKVSDIVMMFGEGDGSLLTDYQADVEDYADAQGGSPTYSEWLSGKFRAAALSYVGQFITPSFVREFVDSDMEHSYKRVYEETESGALTEAGQYGETMRTDYADAQIRKVTRSNPLLGWILDFVLQPNTSYTEEGMPLVEIYDPYAIAQMQSWSINDENGDPLPWDVQEERILSAIAMLQSTDDMEALYQSGFMLDYDTREAVGDTIWDIVTKLTDDYNEMKRSGGLNYYNLSPTDPYGEGAAMAAAINSAYYDEKAYWESLYYDKLMSEPMRRTIPIYNRYKTDYAQDANGEFYATGYYANTGLLASLSPVVIAPGTVTDPGDTLGREMNWETPSVIGTGISTGERALIPTEQGHYDWVDLEAHAASGDGTGYSKRWNGGADTVASPDDDRDDGDGSGSDNGGSGRPWSYGRRSGGGGGGGYSPNLYSRLPNLYMPTVRTMYGERVYDPSYDYLRPNFETKGSREAYKRSDI